MTYGSTAPAPSGFSTRSSATWTLVYETLPLPADPGLTLVTYSAEPGSSSEGALEELERWSATHTRLAAVEAEAKA